jgi:hypothetical protein
MATNDKHSDAEVLTGQVTPGPWRLYHSDEEGTHVMALGEPNEETYIVCEQVDNPADACLIINAQKFRVFIEGIAKIPKDNEKVAPGGTLVYDEEAIMENDDAWEGMHRLISEARELLGISDPEEN